MGEVTGHNIPAIDKFSSELDILTKAQYIDDLEKLPANKTVDLFTNLKLKIGTKVEISTTLDTTDGLFNGSPGVVQSFDLKNGEVHIVNVLFERNSIGKKWMRTK